MAAPKTANTDPASATRRGIGLEPAAEQLRREGGDHVDPAQPTRHFHDSVRCWTPTICAGREALAELRELAAARDDDQLAKLLDQIAEYFPADAS